MLPAVLVLLVASSALASPTVEVTTSDTNDVPAQDNSGILSTSERLISGPLINRAMDLVDGGDVYTFMIQANLEELANKPDARSQASAVAQLLALLGELVFGVPGDACDAAAVVNEVVNNPSSITARLNGIVRLANNIDYINQLALNPNALRFATGPRGNCAYGGRIYPFKAAWNLVLRNTTSQTFSIYNEQYCATKRLYQAFDYKTNNVAAAVTATAANTLAINAVQRAMPQIVNFFKIVVNGEDGTAQARIAKAALLQSIRA